MSQAVHMKRRLCSLTTSRSISPLMSMASKLIHSHGRAGNVMSNCRHRHCEHHKHLDSGKSTGAGWSAELPEVPTHMDGQGVPSRQVH